MLADILSNFNLGVTGIKSEKLERLKTHLTKMEIDKTEQLRIKLSGLPVSK
jgi:hypothetical protein